MSPIGASFIYMMHFNPEFRFFLVYETFSFVAHSLKLHSNLQCSELMKMYKTHELFLHIMDMMVMMNVMVMNDVDATVDDVV